MSWEKLKIAAIEEMVGAEDLKQPLSPEEIAQAQQAGINIPGTEGGGAAQMGEVGEMPQAPWTENNVGVDAVQTDMELSPEVIAELMEKTNGEGEVMLAESNDRSRSMEAIMSEAGVPQQAGAEQETQQHQDDGLSPMQRAEVKWELMKQGITQWFSENWPILLAGLIAAAAVIVAAIVASGGAALAALPALLKVMVLVFAAELITQIGEHLRDYVSKAWEGDIQGGTKSLAKALAIGAIEIAFELIPVLGKGIKKGFKAATKGVKAVTKGVAKGVKGATRAVVKGAKYTIQKGKVILKGVAGTGIGKK